jgi:hypothetical protein
MTGKITFLLDICGRVNYSVARSILRNFTLNINILSLFRFYIKCERKVQTETREAVMRFRGQAVPLVSFIDVIYEASVAVYSLIFPS